MRRIPLTLAATAALLPVVYALSAVPAQAANGSLAVTTIGRNGARITSTVNILSMSTWAVSTVHSGQRASLAKGRYAVLTDIQTPDTSPAVMGMTDTLAAQEITVSGSDSLTLDARKGKQIKISLDATSGSAAKNYTGFVNGAVCAGPTTLGQVGAYNEPGGLYEIPNSSRDLSFAWLQSWQGDSNGTGYLLSSQSTGLPAVPSAGYRKSQLAQVNATARRSEQASGATSIELQPTPAQLDCQTDLWGGGYQQDAPFSRTFYVTPGVWTSRTDIFGSQGDIGGAFASPTDFLAGHSYSQIFGKAVWGPTSGIPYVSGRAVRFDSSGLINDATGGTDGSAGSRGTVTLTRNGKTVKSQSYSGGAAFSAGINAAGWYNLVQSGARTTAGTLSSNVTVNWHFYANPATSQVLPGYTAQLSPAGLGGFNQATPKSTTDVAVYLSRTQGNGWYGPGFAKETVKSLQMWSSGDNGKTWQTIQVSRSGNHFVAAVHNPASGAVALRTLVTDTQGNTSDQTIVRAYAIG
ncbi:hypothetical protein [Streptacidiphilus sp. EB103A]|uniref:hypothetical protein n=1 Tax=Streptacidiphilus sp. EB103A TaxID=3156275 RepID=UPI0035143057